jgi:CubicO group peptidase (beta-lactamase class C family)
MKTPRFCIILLSFILFISHFSVSAEDDYTDSIKTFLHDNFDHKNVGMVIGIVDERGNRFFSAGSMDNGTDQEPNGETVFEIGSVSKTFTTLLLQDMVERKDMALDDPVSKYLPETVKMPAYNGKEITLLDLATHTSGLPFNPDNLSHGDNLFADYTAGKMYDYLSGYALNHDPGIKFEYSNTGMGLLGHVISLKAGKDYETLVVERICRPLDMQSTCITLTPELKARLATGHDKTGNPVTNWDFQVMAGAGAIRSTANDLLKYVSANLGLTKSNLTPLMQKNHVIRHRDSPKPGDPDLGNTAMPWFDNGVYNPPGMELLGHAGGTGGYSAFIGFDKQNRRGVVVLANQQGRFSSGSIGWRILQLAQLSGKDIATMMPVRWHVGIGTGLEIDEKTHTLQITKILPNSPAAQAGLSTGLIVQKIDEVPTAGKSLAECTGMLRGTADTKVRLELVDSERKHTSKVELTRQRFLIDE